MNSKNLFYLAIASLPIALMADIDIEALKARAENSDASAAYELAKHFEEKGNNERSLLWYKRAAILSFEAKNTKNKELEDSLQEQIQRVERSEKVYGSFLDTYQDDPEARQSVKQTITKIFGIAPYKTNYLLPYTYDDVGHGDRKRAETKFQLSFQKSIVDDFFGLNESIVLAYTQTSWWQTTAESAPFRETNYQPELFVIMPHFDSDSFIKAYQIGLIHESNGQGKEKSRSWNRLYAKAYLQAGGLIISPRVWYRFSENASDDDNPNIHKYLGYGDLELMYPWRTHTFKLLLRNNFDFKDNRGAAQFDWSFPLWEKNLFGYIQLYSGYSESLIDYDKRSNRVGIGFALSR